jgi:hypothetical protein
VLQIKRLIEAKQREATPASRIASLLFPGYETVRDISKARLDVLGEWLRGVEQINRHGEEYRSTRVFTFAFMFTSMDAKAIDRQTTVLFGGWGARRQVAVYSLIGAYQRPSSLVTALVDVFERTQKVVSLAHHTPRNEQTLDRLISWQRKLRELLDNAYGTTVTAADIAWLIRSEEAATKGDLDCISHCRHANRKRSADEQSNRGPA